MKNKFQEVKLDDALKFYNGKAIALNGVGLYPVYGSNGIVGYSDKFIFENCIIIGRVGEYCGSIQYCKEKFWATDNTIVVKPKDGYDVQYLSYLLALINLNWFSGGSAQPLITHGWIKPIKASIPDYQTQNKIGSILFGYDDLIENNLQRIKLLEEYAQITFNDWFINLKKMPKGWQEKKLGSLVGYEIGGGWGEEIQNREFSEAAYVIRGTDIDALPLGKLENVPYRFHKKSNLASRKLQDGDIVFEVSGGSSFEGVAKTLFITDELLTQFKSDVICASFCKLLRPASRELSNFVFLFLRFLREIKGTEVFEIRSASNIVNYNWTAFLKFQKVKVPDGKILQQFNEIIDPIYKQIYNLGHQNRLLKEARDILLPRLMTGMIEVKATESKVVSIAPPKQKEATWEFKEAVLISMLTEKFGNEKFPLGRKRYTKLSYLFHRHADNQMQNYLRKAAGPYNPKTKYAGPEKIAHQNGYVADHKNGNLTGFIAGKNISTAKTYFENYWSIDYLNWLDTNFHYKSNDQLELYATVDNAMLELHEKNKTVNVEAVKQIIKTEKEWKAKLEREIFNDANIQKAINYLPTLFQYS